MTEYLIADTCAFLSTFPVTWYRTDGLSLRRFFLLHGLPGTGTTSTGRVLSSDIQLEFCVINVTDRSLSNQVFNVTVAKLILHSLLLIMDVDALLHKQVETIDSVIVHETALSGLLDELEGVILGTICDGTDDKTQGRARRRVGEGRENR